MRIVIIADPIDNQLAGVHTYTRELINALIKYDKQNEYILLRERRDDSLDIRQIAIPNTRLPLGFASLRLFFLIPAICRRVKADMVIEPAHFGPFNLPHRIKRVTVIHDLTPILFPAYHRFHSQLLQKIFLKVILKRSHLVLTNSAHTRKDVEGHYPFCKGKTEDILLGRDTFFKLDTDPIEEEPYFLNVGTIEPRKNLNVLLKGWEEYRRRNGPVKRLVIAGAPGWKSNDFYQSLKDHPFADSIELKGYLPKETLRRHYANAMAFIYPSLYEGFGFPILEALSCGCHVICSDTSSHPEVGGDYAGYFPPQDTAQLVDLMMAVDNTYISSEKVHARIAWADTFSWEKYVSTLVPLLERVVKE